MGRTARGRSGRGRALLLLLPEELGFLAYLKVPLCTAPCLYRGCPGCASPPSCNAGVCSRLITSSVDVHN